MSDSRPSPPIFVVGVPRSGTTLLAAMLAAHPRLVCGPETHFFNHLDAIGARALRRRDDWPRGAIDYLYSIKHVGESIPANYGLTRQELAEALARREPSIPSILSGMVELYMERHGKRRWVEKTPDHLPHVARIREYYPDAPIIRIIRDPRDVAASLLSVSWGPSTWLDAILSWKNFDDHSARFFEVDSRCHTLRYEDLVHDPEPALRGLCQAIGEDFDPAMLDTSGSARLVNAVNEPCKAKVAEKVDASRVEAWRLKQSEDELRLAEALLGERLRAYAYPVLGLCSHYVELHSSIAATGEYAEVVSELVARGARFWGLPGEQPELSLFLGDPSYWLGDTPPARLAGTARLAWSVLRRRLTATPVAWLHAPGRASITGRRARALSWVLPRPLAGRRIPQFAHHIDPN